MPTHRCYTIADVCELLRIPRHSLVYLRERGELPMPEELRPLGHRIRYRADLIDRYLDLGLWNAPRDGRG